MKKTGRVLLCSVLAALLLLTFAMPALAANSQTATVDGIKYTISGTNATVNGYDGKLGSITIPATITVGGVSASVVAIAPGAFRNNTQLTRVTVEAQSLEEIGAQAFYGCTSLGMFSGEVTVTKLGAGAFSKTKLTALPGFVSSLTEIPDSAFSGCTELVGMVTLNSATKIGVSAFSGCSQLLEVTMNVAESVGTQAFSSCSSLTTVTASELQTVGASAFMNCTVLTGTIGEDAFPKVQEIGQSAFKGTSISTVGGSSLVSIGETAFYASKVATVNLLTSESLTIGPSAFGKCVSLDSVTLPASLKSIGAGVFSGTPFDPKTHGVTGAKEITFNGTKAQWEQVTGASNYSSHRIVYTEGSGDANDSPTPTATSNLWNPNMTPAPTAAGPDGQPTSAPADNWAWFMEEVFDSSGQRTLREVTAPKSGQELILRASAAQGTLSFNVNVVKPAGTIFDISQDKAYLDSSRPGIGNGMKAVELPVTVTGRVGDKFEVILSGTYTLDGKNYPIEKKLTLTVRSELQITPDAAALKNVTATDPVVLTASWGPESVLGKNNTHKFEWTCRDPRGNEVKLNPNIVDDETVHATAVFGAVACFGDNAMQGRYVVTCHATGTALDGTKLDEWKTIPITVLGAGGLKPQIDDGKQLTNMIPGDRTTLRITWPEGTPQAEQIRYAWTCSPNQSALTSGITGQSTVFCPADAGKYKISCTVTIAVVKADPSTWITRTVSKDAKVSDFGLTIVSNGNETMSKGATANLTAQWAPNNPDTAEGGIYYTWYCSRNGSNVTNEVFQKTPDSNEVEFTPISEGDYTVRCTSTAVVEKGRTVQRTATYRIKVGLTLTLSATQSEKSVESGQQIEVNGPVTVRATVVPPSTTGTAGYEYKWSITGAKFSGEEAPTNDSATFTPDRTGTVTVSCSVGSGAGASSASVSFTVVNKVLKISLKDGADKDNCEVDTPITLTAELDGGSSSDKYTYVWEPKSPALTWDKNVATFQTSKTGAYTIRCKVKDEDSNVVANESIRLIVRRHAVAAPAEPKLKIISSIPAAQGELKVSVNTPFTLTGVWENGTVPADGTGEGTTTTVPDIKWKLVKTHKFVDGEPVMLTPDVDKEDYDKDITDNGTKYMNGSDTLSIHDPYWLSVGIYKATCTSGEKEKAELDIYVYKDPVLVLHYEISSGTQTLKNTEQSIPVKTGTVLKLQVGWDPPQEHKNENEWYSWTCTSNKTGNVSGAAFQVNPANRDSSYILTIPATSEPDEEFTVACTVNGYNLPTSVPSAKTAKLVFSISETSSQSLSTTALSALELQAVPNDRTTYALTRNSMMQLRYTGVTAAGAGKDAATVDDVVNSFASEAGQSVLVTDAKGQAKLDGTSRIATGDVVQLRDADGAVVDEATVVVMGDALGTGEMCLSQLVAMAKGLKDESILTGPYMEAGDWDENNRINLSDIVVEAGEMKKALSA